MAKFYSFYLNKGIYKDKRLLSWKTIELMLTNQLADNVIVSPAPPQPENFQFGLGGFALETTKNDYLSPLTIGSFGWGGAFNTHGWGGPQRRNNCTFVHPGIPLTVLFYRGGVSSCGLSGDFKLIYH